MAINNALNGDRNSLRKWTTRNLMSQMLIVISKNEQNGSVLGKTLNMEFILRLQPRAMKVGAMWVQFVTSRLRECSFSRNMPIINRIHTSHICKIKNKYKDVK